MFNTATMAPSSFAPTSAPSSVTWILQYFFLFRDIIFIISFSLLCYSIWRETDNLDNTERVLLGLSACQLLYINSEYLLLQWIFVYNNFFSPISYQSQLFYLPFCNFIWSVFFLGFNMQFCQSSGRAQPQLDFGRCGSIYCSFSLFSWFSRLLALLAHSCSFVELSALSFDWT